MANDPTPSARGALLTGATGLVGRALLADLLKSGSYRAVTVLARGPQRGIAAEPKLDWRQIDFMQLPQPFPAVDDVYIALGTTIKVAGSESAFRQVDFDHVVAVAKAARSAGAARLAVVSALGADPKSRVFYNRVKGEMQVAIGTLGYDSVAIAQPSLLLGDRPSLGQPERRGEVFAARVLGPLLRFIPKGVRPIAAERVAAALVDATLAGRPGVRVLSSGQMQTPRD